MAISPAPPARCSRDDLRRARRSGARIPSLLFRGDTDIRRRSRSFCPFSPTTTTLSCLDRLTRSRETKGPLLPVEPPCGLSDAPALGVARLVAEARSDTTGKPDAELCEVLPECPSHFRECESSSTSREPVGTDHSLARLNQRHRYTLPFSFPGRRPRRFGNN